jgi:hypothetical protein
MGLDVHRQERRQTTENNRDLRALMDRYNPGMCLQVS